MTTTYGGMDRLLGHTQYDNDLELAAELGKVLLDRNRELEAQILQLQRIADDRDQEVGLLTKQVEVLRHANTSRMRIYEEVDKNAQELEKVNEKLRKSLREEKEKVKSLNETVESLELKLDELQAKLEQEKRDKKKKSATVEYNRAWSVPSLVEENVDYKGLSPGSFDYLGFPSLNEVWKKQKSESNNKEIKDLKENVKLLKLQYFAEQKRRIDVESDLFSLQNEKENLVQKVRQLHEDVLKKEELKKELLSSTKDEPRRSSSCGKCSSRAASIAGSDIADSEFIEHDLDELPRKEVVRLKCGGSAYGSKESLNLIGLEAVTPTLESCSDILATAVESSAGSSQGDDGDFQMPDPDSTLLGELEEQYRKLVRKYEHLVEVKNKKLEETKDTGAQINTGTDEAARRRPKSLAISKEVQTAWRKSSCFDFTSPVNPIEGHFQKGPPEYKKLFKEIFETLKKAANDDDGTTPSS